MCCYIFIGVGLPYCLRIYLIIESSESPGSYEKLKESFDYIAVLENKVASKSVNEAISSELTLHITQANVLVGWLAVARSEFVTLNR